MKSELYVSLQLSTFSFLGRILADFFPHVMWSIMMQQLFLSLYYVYICVGVCIYMVNSSSFAHAFTTWKNVARNIYTQVWEYVCVWVGGCVTERERIIYWLSPPCTHARGILPHHILFFYYWLRKLFPVFSFGIWRSCY